jgi:hypothetical protein
MKLLLIAITTLLSFSVYSQSKKYEYCDFDCYESFDIVADSFVYEHSCGLMNGTIKGTVEYSQDTLILNSELQPPYIYNKSVNDSIHADSIVLKIKSLQLLFDFGLRIYERENYKDLGILESDLFKVHYNKKARLATYKFSRELLSRNEKLYFILYRTNILFELDWRNQDENQFEIVFDDSIDNIIDYHFFTNQKAIIENGNLILISDEGKREMTNFTVQKKKGIIISKKKKIKKYKKST